METLLYSSPQTVNEGGHQDAKRLLEPIAVYMLNKPCLSEV